MSEPLIPGGLYPLCLAQGSDGARCDRINRHPGGHSWEVADRTAIIEATIGTSISTPPAAVVAQHEQAMQDTWREWKNALGAGRATAASEYRAMYLALWDRRHQL